MYPHLTLGVPGCQPQCLGPAGYVHAVPSYLLPLVAHNTPEGVPSFTLEEGTGCNMLVHVAESCPGSPGKGQNPRCANNDSPIPPWSN